MELNINRNIRQVFGIIFGAILFAVGYSWFLIPYKIVPGGVGGIGQILFYIFNIPVGISMILINIPLFLISLKIFGNRFGIRSLFGMLATSIFTDILSLKRLAQYGFIDNLEQYAMTTSSGKIMYTLLPNDIYLSAITGSVLLGIGLGIIFRFRGSTGGTDIPVGILKKKFGISMGTGYWIVESMIILTVGIVFKDPKLIIWGYINLFITAKLTDIASEGLPYIRGVYIVSERNDEIKQEIYNYVNRGVTYFHGEGGYSGKKMKVLFCAMNRRQVAIVRDIVKDIDPTAFVILTEVYDIMGYGFRTRNIDLGK
ncbi:MAG: YitT family protein [Candidatus Cloacimonadota bacterium]|nr:YitT family protein [Candidatus Cloacimonadota bacterium]